MVAPVRVSIPYAPRDAFMPFHNRTKRWSVLVCHRRAGKTVAAINDLVKRSILCPDRVPLFGYVAPYRAQAKSVAWGYLKHYARPIAKNINESDLIVTLRNNAEVRLFGADNADALRGLGFNGILMDEYGDFKPSVWGSVIRPTLADKQGWAVFMGTPKGKNQFWDVYDKALTGEERDDWFTLHLPASKSGILSPEELRSIRAGNTTEDQYQQEYECSFEAAILGAYYGIEMRELADANRISAVPYDPSLPTYTAWDLGYRDDTAIWFYQVVRREIHFIDFHAISGADISDLAKTVLSKPYHYGQHFLPHDARAKTLSSGGKSIIEQLADHLGLANLSIVPNLSVQDGIQAARMMLPDCWFDAIKCKDGIEALRQYEREYDEDKKAFSQKPRHNWTSHPADAFRMAAISWREESQQRKVYPERALVVGPTNQATLEDMWAAAKRQQRYERF
jgi:phage terminase large subunit